MMALPKGWPLSLRGARFDLDEDVRAVLRRRDPEIGLIECCACSRMGPLRSSALDASPRFMRTIAESEALKARAKAICDELAAVVQEGLAEKARRDPVIQTRSWLRICCWRPGALRSFKPIRLSSAIVTRLRRNGFFSPSSIREASGSRRRWSVRLTSYRRGTSWRPVQIPTPIVLFCNV